MEIRIQITRRRLQIAALALVGLGSIGVIYAQTMTEFQPGTVISSSAVNANFAALEARIAELETNIPGYEIKHELVEIPAFGSMGNFVGCSPGRRVTGGGFDLTAEGRSAVKVNISEPHSTGQGWTGNFTSIADSPVHVIMYAICVSSNATP